MTEEITLCLLIYIDKSISNLYHILRNASFIWNKKNWRKNSELFTSTDRFLTNEIERSR